MAVKEITHNIFIKCNYKTCFFFAVPSVSLRCSTTRQASSNQLVWNNPSTPPSEPDSSTPSSLLFPWVTSGCFPHLLCVCLCAFGSASLSPVSCALQLFLVEKAGRRTLHLLGLGGMAVSALVMTISLLLVSSVLSQLTHAGGASLDVIQVILSPPSFDNQSRCPHTRHLSQTICRGVSKLYWPGWPNWESVCTVTHTSLYHLL